MVAHFMIICMYSLESTKVLKVTEVLKEAKVMQGQSHQERRA
jgi:hypothetical protein